MKQNAGDKVQPILIIPKYWNKATDYEVRAFFKSQLGSVPKNYGKSIYRMDGLVDIPNVAADDAAGDAANGAADEDDKWIEEPEDVGDALSPEVGPRDPFLHRPAEPVAGRDEYPDLPDTAITQKFWDVVLRMNYKRRIFPDRPEVAYREAIRESQVNLRQLRQKLNELHGLLSRRLCELLREKRIVGIAAARATNTLILRGPVAFDEFLDSPELAGWIIENDGVGKTPLDELLD
jgi:hypothetical protein